MEKEKTSLLKKTVAIGVLALAAQFNAYAAETAAPAQPVVPAAPKVTETSPVDWSNFVALAKTGYFQSAEVHHDHVTGYHKNEKGGLEKTESRSPSRDIAYAEVRDSGIAKISFPSPPAPAPAAPTPPEPEQSLLSKIWDGTLAFLGSPLGFMVLIVATMIGTTRYAVKMQVGNRNKGVEKFFKPIDPKDNPTRFKDVAGADGAKHEVLEVVDFLKNPEVFEKLGAKCPRGVLLSGPPGTGKTLLAQALAGEAGVPFFQISGSKFVEMFVGVGASRVRTLFDNAKSYQPKEDKASKLGRFFSRKKNHTGAAIIFIDEIDAIGKQRGTGQGGGGESEREQTLNEILVQMDGFEKGHKIIVLAATNRPEMLDAALMRPGRFDRQVTVDLADVKGREEILKVHARNKPLAADVKLHDIARGTPGFSGADLANIVNEAAIFCARRKSGQISQVDFREAIDKVTMGIAGKVTTDPERKALTAYHEAGHVLALMHEPDAPPLHKVTIVPRGNSGGHAAWFPQEEGLQGTVGQMEAHIRIAVAGRVAERLIFGDNKVTGGASADIQSATKTADRMITELGMSKELGMVHYRRTAYGTLDTDPVTAEKITALIKAKVDDAEQFMTRVLTQNMDQLHILAHELMEKETLDAGEVKALIQLQKVQDPRLAVPDFNQGVGIRNLKRAM